MLTIASDTHGHYLINLCVEFSDRSEIGRYASLIWNIVDSDNISLPPAQHQAIIWTNESLFLETNFIEIWIKIQHYA